jgi:hypothetical protein
MVIADKARYVTTFGAGVWRLSDQSPSPPRKVQQVMFLNRTPGGGRVMIADFSSGTPPARVRSWEDWGLSPLLDGWTDDEDWHLVGDFTH